MKRKLFNWFGWFKDDVTEQLLKQMLDRTDLFRSGLCFWSRDMYYESSFTSKERFVIEEMIRTDKMKCNFPFYWVEGLIEPRIVWILEHLKFVRHDYKDDAHFEKYGEHPYVMVKELSFGRSIEWEPTLKKFQKFNRNGNLICEIKKL